MTRRFLQALILIGTVMLVYAQPIYSESGLSLSGFITRSDFPFSLVVVLGILASLLGLARTRKDDNAQLIRLAFAFLWGVGFFALVATFFSLFEFDSKFGIGGWSRLIRIPFSIALTWIVYASIKVDGRLYRWLFRVLFLTPAITLGFGLLWLVAPSLLPSMISSQSGIASEGQIMLVSASSSFQGLTWNPWVVVYSSTIALCFAWVTSLRDLRLGKWSLWMLKTLYCLGLVFILFWTTVRTVFPLLALVFVGGGGLYFYVANRKRLSLAGPILAIVLVIILALLLGLAAWALLPISIQDVFRMRFLEAQVRTNWLWPHYLDAAINHPLGLGMNFFDLVAPRSPFSGAPVGPHNVILWVLMNGGIGALLSTIGFLLSVFWLVKIRLGQVRGVNSTSIMYLGVVLAYLVSWVIYFATDIPPFFDYTHSILLALVLAGPLVANPVPEGHAKGIRVTQAQGARRRVVI